MKIIEHLLKAKLIITIYELTYIGFAYSRFFCYLYYYDYNEQSFRSPRFDVFEFKSKLKQTWTSLQTVRFQFDFYFLIIVKKYTYVESIIFMSPSAESLNIFVLIMIYYFIVEWKTLHSLKGAFNWKKSTRCDFNKMARRKISLKKTLISIKTN